MQAPREPEPVTPVLRLGVVAAAALLLFHLFAITVHAGPISPIKISAASVVDPYIGNTFVQTWTLFAPNPLNDERGLLVRATQRDAVTGETTMTEWTDISTSVVARSQRTRFFSPRESRLIMNLSGMANWKEPYAERLRDRMEALDSTEATAPVVEGASDSAAQLTPVTPDVPFVSPHEESFRADSRAMFGRYATLKAIELWGDDINAVEVRFVVHRFPPFSQRDSDAIGEVIPVDLGWFNVTEFLPES